MVSAIVLAAGLSKRMGNSNKLLLPYRQHTVIEATLNNILAAGIMDIIVVTGYESDKINNAIKHLPATIVDNPFYAQGMTTSIQQGITYAKGNGFMICLSDMMMIEPVEYSLLVTAFEQQFSFNPKCICIPRYGNEKGNPVIFSAYYRTAILKHTDMEGCKAIVQANKEEICWVDMPTNHVLMDMDYPEDYEKLRIQ